MISWKFKVVQLKQSKGRRGHNGRLVMISDGVTSEERSSAKTVYSKRTTLFYPKEV